MTGVPSEHGRVRGTSKESLIYTKTEQSPIYQFELTHPCHSKQESQYHFEGEPKYHPKQPHMPQHH